MNPYAVFNLTVSEFKTAKRAYGHIIACGIDSDEAYRMVLDSIVRKRQDRERYAVTLREVRK